MRILLVEDEQQIYDFLKMSLEAECFVVDTAQDGEKGSYLGRTENYDLIILDNMLPGKDGLHVCKEIRESGKVCPILILSVRSETTTKIDLLNAGADDYLIKPFSLQELLARVRALLRRPQRIEKAVVRIGELALDSQTHIVTYGEKEIVLTRKEFILLEFLMKNANNVLSRGMILEHVWDMSVDPFSNTIESHIMALRKKLEAGKSGKLIFTVPGIGYKLVAPKS